MWTLQGEPTLSITPAVLSITIIISIKYKHSEVRQQINVFCSDNAHIINWKRICSLFTMYIAILLSSIWMTAFTVDLFKYVRSIRFWLHGNKCRAEKGSSYSIHLWDVFFSFQIKIGFIVWHFWQGTSLIENISMEHCGKYSISKWKIFPKLPEAWKSCTGFTWLACFSL